jgi:hypothetical protein
MANGLIDWVFGIAVLIAVILIVYAGFLLVFSRGDSGAVSKGKGMLTNTIIGIVIMLLAWTMVDVVMKMFMGGDFGIWNEVQECGGAYKAGKAKNDIKLNTQSVTVTLPKVVDKKTDSTDGVNTGGGTRSYVSGNLVEYAGKKFDSGVVSKMKYIDENFDLRVSGGYRTATRNKEVNGAKNSYHLSGRAGDFVGSLSAMNQGAAWARSNGAVEVLVHDAGSGNHLHVAF